MLDKNTLRLLRIPFSLYLMPVFFFALSQSGHIHLINTLSVFVILHLLVYPASNGYNSYMDRDETNIGGLKSPPMPTRKLFYTTLALDLIAITVAALLVSVQTSLMIAVYILMSRAYSYRGIRLKKYPLAGFLTVVIFQGAFSYLFIYQAINAEYSPEIGTSLLLCMVATSCLLAANYPLSQVYQHEADKKDGVRTISILLGYKGTFLFSGIFFLGAAGVLFEYFYRGGDIQGFLVFSIFSAPVMIYFLQWFFKVYKNPSQASFENTMKMNKIAALSLISCFLCMLLMK